MCGLKLFLLFSDKARTFSPWAHVQGKNTVIVFSDWYLQADIWESQKQTKYWYENISLLEICKVKFGIDMLDWPNVCMTQNLVNFNSDVTPCPLNQHLEFICQERYLQEVDIYGLFLVTKIAGEDALKLNCLLNFLLPLICCSWPIKTLLVVWLVCQKATMWSCDDTNRCTLCCWSYVASRRMYVREEIVKPNDNKYKDHFMGESFCGRL